MSETPSTFKLPLRIGRKYPQDVEDESGKLVCCVPKEQAAEIVQAVNFHALLQEAEKALEMIFPIAKAYLAHAPSHPDNAKIETTEDVLSRLRAAREVKA